MASARLLFLSILVPRQPSAVCASCIRTTCSACERTVCGNHSQRPRPACVPKLRRRNGYYRAQPALGLRSDRSEPPRVRQKVRVVYSEKGTLNGCIRAWGIYRPRSSSKPAKKPAHSVETRTRSSHLNFLSHLRGAVQIRGQTSERFRGVFRWLKPEDY